MGEILVRPMETKDHPQEPIRVSCKNGANLLQTLLDAGILWIMPAVERAFVGSVK